MISDKIRQLVIQDLMRGVQKTDIAKKYNITRQSIYNIEKDLKEGIEETKEKVIRKRKEVIDNVKRMGVNKYYTFICYLNDESYNDYDIIEKVKEKVKEKLEQVDNICAILHDKDCDEDGVMKKSHYHVILYYQQGVKYDVAYSDITGLGIFSEDNIKKGELVNNVESLIEYMTHSRKKDSNKYQYNIDELIFGVGFDIESIRSKDKELVMLDIVELLDNDLNIHNIVDIMKYYKDDKDRISVITSKAYAVNAICNSYNEKRNREDVIYNELKENKKKYENMMRTLVLKSYRNLIRDLIFDGYFNNIIDEYNELREIMKVNGDVCDKDEWLDIQEGEVLFKN